ncbi:MAG: ankyrin repeat domain-containing protein, partial [Magnetococcales bacterium]|nr:ankyrin repeat domain-containing protein [Magnetococcales bacterium]
GLLLSSFVGAPSESEHPERYQPTFTVNRELIARNSATPLLDRRTGKGFAEILPAKNSAPDLRGRTPLMLAAASGKQERVRQLLNAGADVHARDWWGRTALLIAISEGHREIVTLLIEHNADIST